MKDFLRRVSQALGIYYLLGLLLARWQAWRKGIRLERTPDGAYSLTNKTGRKLFLGAKHAIYLMDFIAYFDFYFEGVEPDANDEVHFEKPGWHTPRGWGHPLYFTSFAESQEVMALYLAHGNIKPGAIIFDLGAYCGLTAIAFAQQVGDSGHVYAFEPDPNNFAALRTNVEKYGGSRISAENLAVWKETGEIRFQAESTISSSIQSLSARTDSTVAVRSIRLSEFVETNSIKRLDLIKMDVEGAEVEILGSSLEVLRRFHPTVIVESHNIRDVSTGPACAALLHEVGYHTTEIPQPGTKSLLVIGRPA